MVAGYQLIDRPLPAAGTIICRARRAQDDAPVWLLWPAPDPQGSVAHRGGRLRRQYELLRSLAIPGIATPTALLEAGEGSLAMELNDCQGETLAERLERGPLGLEETLHIARRLAVILADLHGRGLTAGCFRPRQLIVGRPASDELCWLAADLASRPAQPDLGKLSAEDLACISPEQTGYLDQPVDHRSDLYSLGILLYRLLTGRPPFAANDPLGWVHCHAARLPRPPEEIAPTLPPVLSRVVMKLLAKAPDERYQSAYGLRLDLEACIARLDAHGHIAPFELAQNDIAPRFRIANKLFGRAAEVAQLQRALRETAASGQCSTVLVSGASGVGKTALIEQLRAPAMKLGAHFVAGKFDQYRRGIPYATLGDALRDLVRQVLAQPEATLAAWRQALLEALAGNAKLIVELIPELALITGPPEQVAEMPPAEAENRFHRVFRRFLGVFARDEHPLVLFLDDLQWLDAGTGKLIEELVLHPETRHLLVVGAYRTGLDDSDASPLAPMLARLRVAAARIETIELGPLAVPPLAEFVADTLHLRPAETERLARLVRNKTGGNPFFFKQFLRDLHDDGLLRFDPETRAWRCDLSRIEPRSSTANVTELMLARLVRQPPEAHRYLSIAACLGNDFDVATIALLADCPSDAVRPALARAAEDGLVEQDDDRWRFAQDRVQEAAYSLLPEAHRPALHLRVGRHLLEKLEPAALAEQVFDVVDHLNRGRGLLCERAERMRLAQLNAAAGRKAKGAVAYLAARDYFATSIALLPADAWETSYAETFSLHLELAECEYLAGHFAAADQQFDKALARAQSALDRAHALRLRCRLYQTQGRFGAGMALLLQALSLFGVDLPTAEEDLRSAAEAEVAMIADRLRGRAVSELGAAPRAVDPIGSAVISLLVEALGPAYAAKPHYFPLLAAKAVTYSLEHGNIPESAIAYAAYAIVLVSHPASTRTAVAFSEMALALLDRLADPRPRGLVLVGHGGMVYPWVGHIEAGLPYVERGLGELVEAGDFLNAAYSALFPLWGAFEGGHPLPQVLATAERYATLTREVHHRRAHDTLRLCQHLLASLCAPAPSAPPGEMAPDDRRRAEQSMAEFAGARWDLGIAYYKVMQQVIAFLEGRYEEAAAAAEAAWAVLSHRRPMPLATTLTFFRTLTAAALHRQTNEAGRAEIVRSMQRNLDRFRNWAQHGPAGFAHRAALIAAELARVEGRIADAMRHYEDAIAAARSQGLVQYEALASELAAAFYRTQGFASIADLYLARARRCYARWGALTKVRRLEAEHPPLRAEPLSAGALLEAGGAAAQLDALALIKTMRAISGEVVLDRLVETLMRVVMEHAGAHKAALLLKRGDAFPTVAEASVEAERLRVKTRVSTGDDADALPATVINYVRRSGETVLLDDVGAPGPFAGDPCLRQARSLLCLPVLQQAQIIGLLYLENRLFTHAFTPERVLAIELLASQAATSLGNAQLYADLQQEIAERRRAEEAWHASEQTLHQLVDVLPIAVYSCDTEGRIENYNPRAVELWGRSPRPGDDSDQFWGPFRVLDLDGNELSGAQCPLAEVLRSGQAPQSREIVIERADGTRRVVVASPVPRHDEQGRLTGIINCLTDTTDRKRAEEALSASRAMFRSLFESAPDAILVVEPGSGQILRANRRAAALFGYEGEALVGQSVEMLLPERFRKRHPQLRAQYLARPVPRQMGSGLELYGRRRDGSEFPVDVTLGTLYTGQGVLALSIVRDVSERKQAEAEHQARQAAEASDRAKSEFLANMSHELRSPLNTILGFARLMASDPQLPPTARDDLQLVLRSGEHLYALINQVLDLSKLEAGRATFNTADFDLHLLLDDLRSLFLPAASSKGLQLLFTRHRKTPRHVHGDSLKLRQVLINLIDNALKFTRTGDVSVHVAPLGGIPEAGEAAGRAAAFRVAFSVSDSGPGIPADERKQLFQAFVQAEAGRQAQQGTGLGLAISRGFVQLMGGQLTLGSEVGRGTTVRFEIPLQQAAASGISSETSRFSRVRGLAHGQPRFRLLVVDDLAEARELLVRLLAPLGFVVKEAADGESAIEAARTWHPDAILMDLMMPGLDGYETVRRIRAEAGARRCIVLAITAGGGEAERARALAAGFDDFLRKPLRESDLFAALERYLKVRFVVEEDASPAVPALDHGALGKLPAAQLAALETALVHLDSEAVERSIAAVRERDAALAQALAASAREFQYDSILFALHRASAATATGGRADGGTSG